MDQVLGNGDGEVHTQNNDYDNLGFHAVAAHFNVVYGHSAMSISDVKDMILSIITTGYYDPPGTNLQWDAAEVVAFIEQTYHGYPNYPGKE